MISDKEMEGYARDCVRLAQLAQDRNTREQLLQMARERMAAAMHENGTRITAHSRLARLKHGHTVTPAS